jgi:transcription elongation factor
MKKNHDIIDIGVTLKHETEKAYLVVSDLTGNEVWVPKSLCELDGSKTELQLSEKFALEKELI